MLVLLLISQVWAAEAGPLVRFFPAEVLRNETVEFKPINGHHFSPEAPQKCGSGNLIEKSPRSIKCQFTQAGGTEAQLNVCDDKLTFCRPTSLPVHVLEKSTGDASALVKNESLNRDLQRKLVPGFIESPPTEATKEAATRGQPVFVMISTDWCPPCNEAKEYLLSSPAFQKSAQNWFKVYVNGDSLSAADWEATVPYRFYPSFVLLNSQMQELGRYTGELRQADFENWAKETSVLVNDPIVDLKARVLARKAGSLKQKLKDLWHGTRADEVARQEERLLDWALAREDRDLLLKLTPTDRFPRLQSQILAFEIGELERQEQQEGKDLKAQKIAIQEKLLAMDFKGDHWSENLQVLCNLDVEKCKAHLSQVPERLDFLAKRGDLLEAEKESQLGDEYFALSSVFQNTGDKAAVTSFASKCTEHFEALKNKSFLKISRSGQQGMVACLELVGDFAREEKTLKALVEAYPSESTFLWRMARMLRKQKKYESALQWADKAETLAYGYNWFTLEILKADLYLDLKRVPEAKKILGEALAQVSLASAQDTRNQSLVERLRDLQAKAEEPVQN